MLCIGLTYQRGYNRNYSLLPILFSLLLSPFISFSTPILVSTFLLSPPLSYSFLPCFTLHQCIQQVRAIVMQILMERVKGMVMITWTLCPVQRVQDWVCAWDRGQWVGDRGQRLCRFYALGIFPLLTSHLVKVLCLYISIDFHCPLDMLHTTAQGTT